MLFCAALSSLCNLLYALAASFAKAGGASLVGLPLVLAIASRCLLGLGASVLGVGRAYVATQTSAKVALLFRSRTCSRPIYRTARGQPAYSF